jgi:hypothetical protein
VDTGSESVILDEGLAADVGVHLGDPGTRTVAGTDETGHRFTRYFATIDGEITVTLAPHCRITRPEVMFQKIIHDGLVGSAFLRNYITTYDLANRRMIFGLPGLRDELEA